MDKTRIYMGIPSTGHRHEFQNYQLREIEKHYAGRVELVYPVDCRFRTFHDFARNAIVDEFLASDCEVLWFLDADVVPGRECLRLITQAMPDWEAAACPYPVLVHDPQGAHPRIGFSIEPVLGHGLLTLADYPPNTIAFADFAATGCLFLKRSVFAKLEKPYFRFVYHPETCQVTMGEDYMFARMLAAQGIRFLVDYEMVCKHYKEVCLLDMIHFAQKQNEASKPPPATT